MEKNKIIDIILVVGAVSALVLCLGIYISTGEFEIKGVTAAIGCVIAIKKNGKRMPSYKFYQQHYDFLQENNFQGHGEQKMIRKALFYYNLEKYEKSSKILEKLLDTGDLHSDERTVIETLKENVESYY